MPEILLVARNVARGVLRISTENLFFCPKAVGVISVFSFVAS